MPTLTELLVLLARDLLRTPLVLARRVLARTPPAVESCDSAATHDNRSNTHRATARDSE